MKVKEMNLISDLKTNSPDAPTLDKQSHSDIFLSLIVPVSSRDEVFIERFIKEAESFFSKWPFTIEAIFILDPVESPFKSFSDSYYRFINKHLFTHKKIISSDLTLTSSKEKITSVSDEKYSQTTNLKQIFHKQIIKNTKFKGRGPSLQEGLSIARGEWLIPFSIDASIPLGEFFSILQEVSQDPPPDLVIGNRQTAKKKREIPQRSSWFWTVEKILIEKWRIRDQSIVDPLCPTWALNKKFYQLNSDKFRIQRWHYTLDLLDSLRDQIQESTIKIRQIPLLNRDHHESQIPLIKEYLRNLFFV